MINTNDIRIAASEKAGKRNLRFLPLFEILILIVLRPLSEDYIPCTSSECNAVCSLLLKIKASKYFIISGRFSLKERSCI
jgi:hypothetical protein